MAHYRKIRGLLLAKPLEASPHPPGPRPTGTKLLGLTYERKVARALGGRHGQWFYFEDENGPGCCQTDLLLRGWIVEVKLTDTREAEGQLRDLYLPVVTLALGGTWRPLKVVKHLAPWSTYVVGSRREASGLPPALLPTLQWTGLGRIP